MKQLTHPQKAALRKAVRLRRKPSTFDTSLPGTNIAKKKPSLPRNGSEVRVICLYPSVHAGKLARQWLETALHTMDPKASGCIEYFNYAVLSHDAISWEHVIGRIRPDIILIVGDGHHTLGSGFRHSLRDLLSHSSDAGKPLVIFRDLEPEPTINTQVLLDYIAALSRQNHCELSAMNGNGTPIGCFGHRQLLLKPRKHHE